MRIRSTFLLLGLLALALAPTAGGQEFGGPDDPFMAKTYSVPDTQDVLFLTEEARKAVAAESFEKAALKLQRILDFHQSSVIRVGRWGRETYVGSREWVHGYLKTLPEEGMKAYRELAAPEAMRLLERAEMTRDPVLLTDVLQRFYLSGVGPAARRATATHHLTRGDFSEAAWHLGRLIADFPGETRTEDLARLAFAFAKGGDVEGYERFESEFARRIEAGGTVRVGDAIIDLADFLAPLTAEIDDLAEKAPPGDTSWPVFGRTADRVEPAPELTRVGSDGWTIQTGFRTKNDDFDDNVRWGGMGGDGLPANFYPIHPVVDRGVVYLQNGQSVSAVNLYTGKLVWTAKGPYQNMEGKTNMGTLLSPAVKDGRVFVNLEERVPQPPSDSRNFGGRTVIYYIPQRRLFALDSSDGTILWSHQNAQIERSSDRDLLTDINVNSPPLVIGDTVYVTASRQALRYFSYVLAVDARTGRVKWRTRVCTGQQELNLFGRPIKELASSAISERDGKLYYVSNLGVAASIDRRTGTIQWIKGYPIIEIPFSVRWYMTEERPRTWTNSAPVVTEDAVYFTPTDARWLVALNRKDGTLRFRWDGTDPRRGDEVFRHLLGVGPKFVYIAGPRVLALDRRTGKVAWRSTKGNFQQRKPNEDREVAQGRGIVTPRAIVTLTQRGIYSFHPDTGDRIGFDPIEFQSEDRRRGFVETGGNLVAAGQVLLVSQQRQITAFYLWERIYDELRRRERSEPKNPHLALEMGEVYAQGQRYDEAVAAFGRARGLARTLPVEEGERVSLAARKGLYRIHMLQGTNAVDADDRARAAKHFKHALESSVDEPGRIRAMLALADYYRFAKKRSSLRSTYETLESDLGDVMYDFPAEGLIPAGLHALLGLTDMALDSERPGEAIGFLGAIISKYPRRELFTNVESHVYARDRIQQLIDEHGRLIYSATEKRAQALLETARDRRSDTGIEAVTRLYPNSRAAETASVELGRLLLVKGDYRKATASLRRILSEFPDSPKAPTVMVLLAEALEKKGYLLSAKSALARLARRYPNAKIKVGGQTLSAGEYARRRLEEEQYAKLASKERKVTLPLTQLWSDNEGDNSYVRVLETAGITPPDAEGILLLGTNGVLRAVEGATKRVLWSREMNGIVTKPVFAEGNLVLVNSATVSAVSPQTGDVLWTVSNNASVRAVGANPGTVFVLTADFRDPTNLTLQAFAPRTGEVVWEKNLEDHQAYDMLLLTEEVVGVASRDPSGVTLFDSATGRLRFRVEMAPRTLYREPFLVDEEKLFVVHGNDRFELYDMSSGRKIWETALPKDRYFRSAIPVPGGIFFTDTQEHLLLIDAKDGKIRWTVPPTPESPLQYQGEAADRDRVFVVRRQESSGFYLAEARDLRTGEIVWRAKLVESKSATPEPILTDRYAVYHVNSYDFSQSAWTATSVFLDKATGKIAQELSPDELKGYFTYAFLRDGLFCLNARGRVAVFGNR